MLEVGTKVLATCSWFYAPDGKDYRVVFGTVKSIKSSLDVLGIALDKTKWFVEIGNITLDLNDISTVIRTDRCDLYAVSGCSYGNGNYTDFKRPSAIYNADQ